MLDVRSTLLAVLQDVPFRVDRESCALMPAKSISFLVGVGPDARVDHHFTQCRRCSMADCDYRRGPAAATVPR